MQITHSAGLMFFLAPELRAKTVTAFMNKLDAQVDIADAIAVRMTNGAVVTVGSTGFTGGGDPGILEVHLHGDKGRLLYDGQTGLTHLHLHNGTKEHYDEDFSGLPVVSSQPAIY